MAEHNTTTAPSAMDPVTLAVLRGRLLARGANTEVGASHDHIALAHAAHEVGPHRFEAVARQHVQAVLHGMAGGEYIGVDVSAQFPDPVGVCHTSTSRGSVMQPRTADAATVYGDARYTCAVAEPMRPLKLRAVLEMTVVLSPTVSP